MKYIYTATIHEEDGKFYCRVPDIPGCISTGNDLPEAIEMITDALALCLSSLRQSRKMFLMSLVIFAPWFRLIPSHIVR